jgi:hypothetical protein
MRRTSVSRPHRLVCPACGYGALHPRGLLSRSAYYCESCWCSFGGAIVGTLKQIAALPDAVRQTRLRGVRTARRCALWQAGRFTAPPADPRWCLLPNPTPLHRREPCRRRRTKRVAGIGVIGGIGRAEQG